MAELGHYCTNLALGVTDNYVYFDCGDNIQSFDATTGPLMLQLAKTALPVTGGTILETDPSPARIVDRQGNGVGDLEAATDVAFFWGRYNNGERDIVTLRNGDRSQLDETGSASALGTMVEVSSTQLAADPVLSGTVWTTTNSAAAGIVSVFMPSENALRRGWVATDPVGCDAVAGAGDGTAFVHCNGTSLYHVTIGSWTDCNQNGAPCGSATNVGTVTDGGILGLYAVHGTQVYAVVGTGTTSATVIDVLDHVDTTTGTTTRAYTFPHTLDQGVSVRHEAHVAFDQNALYWADNQADGAGTSSINAFVFATGQNVVLADGRNNIENITVHNGTLWWSERVTDVHSDLLLVRMSL